MVLRQMRMRVVHPMALGHWRTWVMSHGLKMGQKTCIRSTEGHNP